MSRTASVASPQAGPDETIAPRLPVTTIAALAILVLSLLVLRVALWRFTANIDLQGSFVPWQNYLIEHGRWRALQQPVSDYFPAYFDLTALTSYFDGHLGRITQIKLISFSFDLIAACTAYFLVGRILRDRPFTHRKRIAQLVAPFCILAGPTVLLDGSVWGQTDILYTTLLLLTVYAVIAESGAAAALFFGFALAFKLQSVFLIPFLGAMLLRRRIRWFHLLLMPLGWILSIVPAMAVGASPWTFFKLPLGQGDEFRTLVINLGNPWLIVDRLKVSYRFGLLAGLVLTAVVVVGFSIWGSRSRFQSPTNTLALAALSLATMPYVMPKMHDRYMFPAEVVLCILSCVESAFVLPAALILSASLLEYCNYFLQHVRLTTLGVSLLANTYALFLLYRHTQTQTATVEPLAE